MTFGLSELAVVIVIAAGLGVAARILRQPLILAYLLTGVVIGYAGFSYLADRETFRVFADLGIMFLLFLVGLEINYTSLRLVGRAALVIGLAQILVTFGVGFLISQFLNFSFLSSLYLATALTFSSTVIVVKLLSEKRDLSSLYGKISIGLLLVQDFVAVLMLIVLSGLERGQPILPQAVVATVLKGIALFALMLFLGRKLLPLLLDKVARSQELLFLIGLAWVFFLASVVSKIGFSIEIAGFLAGIALANSSEHFELAGRVRPLRDFFIVIFFVILGSSIVFTNFAGLIIPILLLSLFVLVGKPLIMLAIMGLLRYRKRTSFLTAVTTAQISEFSLILAALGLRVGHISEDIASIVTAVGIITITTSAYFIVHADRFFRAFPGFLKIFERRRTAENGWLEQEFRKPVILVGCHRIGKSIAASIPSRDLLVIDFDPEVIADLRKRSIDYLFGDVSDPEIFEKANFGSARLVISTSPDFEDNLGLLNQLGQLKSRPKMVIRAEDEKEAGILYERGADYVLYPYLTAGQYIGKTIAVDPEAKILEQLKKRDLELLKQQSSPSWG